MIDTLTTTYLIMEYVEGEDLESCLSAVGCLKEEEARAIFRQVVSAVHFLHQRRIAHRDIKLENILVDAAGNAKLCDFGMAIEMKEGEMLEEICGSLLYWAPEILARKPYDGLAGDMWSLGIVLYVLVTGHFPYVEPTLEAMHRLVTTSMCPIPYHLSKPCHIIIARLLMVPTWYRITICQLVERPWLAPIQEHVPPATEKLLPRVVETMCAIGYTCEEIVSSLKHRQPNNLIGTMNIIKYNLSCGDSHMQNKTWLNVTHAAPLSLSVTLKRRASEPALPAGKSHFYKEHLEESVKRCRSCTTLKRSCSLEVMPCSGNTVPEEDGFMADVIYSAPENIAVNRNPLDSLPGDLCYLEFTLDGTPTGFVNMGFTEEPSTGQGIPSDQSQMAPTPSGSRPLRGWRLLRKRISQALRALCCCCLPTPR
ncbi:Sperm motility kinase Z [Lemmus lemmus]